MSPPDRDLAEARLRARLARERFVATMGELQERVNPRVLMRDAWTELRGKGDQIAGDALDLARKRPAAVAGVAAAVAAVVLRHPLGRAVTHLFFSPRETESADGKLKERNEIPAAAAPRRRAAGPIKEKHDGEQ